MGELWRRIEVGSCLDKDNSMIIDQLNSSTSSMQSEGNVLLEELENYEKDTKGRIGSAAVIPRHEGKEYQIAMILLQSYQYISFSPEVTKIKVCSALRAFSKRFERLLLQHLRKVIHEQLLLSKKNQKLLAEGGEALLEAPPEP